LPPTAYIRRTGVVRSSRNQIAPAMSIAIQILLETPNVWVRAMDTNPSSTSP